MKQFNVLDRHLDLHRHYLLEASAGTGKTFSIQNIVVRLLIESSPHTKEPFPLNKILVVTFTRAATRDLKQRIRLTIEQTGSLLNEWLETGIPPKKAPDYLLDYLNRGVEFVKKAKKQLQQALFTFDQAQIFTIHSFCARMLQHYAIEGDMSLNMNANSGEEPIPTAEMMRIIRDFFRTGIRAEFYSAGQLTIILKEDPDQKKLLRAIMSGYEFAEMPSCQDLFKQFVEAMHMLKQQFHLNAEQMIEDFKNQSGCYRNYKSGETKAETLAKVIRFATLFDREEWNLEDFDLVIGDKIVWVQALDPKLVKSRSNNCEENLHYPELTRLLKQHLEPIIQTAGDFSILLARLSRDCQKLLKRYQQEEERLSPDDFLRKMEWALNDPGFTHQIQSHYQAAIIDEFQDTDPIQWKIFSTLFLSEERQWPGYLYLVGDPKQSIYSFRQADIYTYLAAARALGEEYCFSLDTNYRSQPTLVQAMNTLFAADHLSDFIPLPKYQSHVPYQPVKASSLTAEKTFHDDKGAIHFFIGDGQELKRAKLSDLESQVFFPFMAKELEQLRQQGMSYRQFAVLVRDRHQAVRLAEYFDKQRIPYINQRGISLADSQALSSLVDILRAVLHPHDLGAIKAALGSPLIGWTHQDLKALEEINPILIQIQKLRQGLLKEGFSYFFQDLLNSKWQKDELTLLERLLMQERGIDIYHDLQQIVGIIIHHQYREWSTPEGLIPFLDLFKIWHEDEDERIKRFQDPSKDGVKILTLHFSKGLEFDVVFALGLLNRMGVREELIPVEREGRLVLAPLSIESEEYHRYCQENDAEKMRQLYVALTRAKHRLYIPVALNIPSDGVKMGEASPLDLFLSRLGHPSTSYQELYDRIRRPSNQLFVHFLDQIGRANFMTYTQHQEVYFEPKEEPILVNELIPPRAVSVPGQQLMMYSFSGLVQQAPLQKKEEEPLLSPPHDFGCQEKSIYTLPANSDTGIFLHHLLEKVTFQDFKEMKQADEAMPILKPFIQQTMFKEWQEVISSLVLNALKTPLWQDNQGFCLADLQPGQLYREIPFLFPYEKGLEVDDLIFSEGFIKGVIDLIFIYRGFYYIVDWKTNWLGSDLNAYERPSLEKAMHENQYSLQASLYKEALRRYLKLVDPRPFEECFGGTFYLFLRGLQAGKSTGIYSILSPYLRSKIRGAL